MGWFFGIEGRFGTVKQTTAKETRRPFTVRRWLKATGGSSAKADGVSELYGMQTH